MLKHVRRSIWYLLFTAQKILLMTSYHVTKLACRQKNGQWVVGVDEMASYIYNIANILPKSVSVSFTQNPFYNYSYDYKLPRSHGLNRCIRYIYGPLLLGLLLNKSDGFFYIWSTGFLIDSFDGRKFEFSFIKRKKKKLVCLFIGNDIRSPKLLQEYSKTYDIDTISTYAYPVFFEATDDSYEKRKQLIASSADTYADLIFNAPVDQPSYLKRQVLPIFYTYPDELFLKDDSKFDLMEPIKIVHAPSSPIIKGTPIVRSAIKKLKEEGYKFEYCELIGVKNEDVRKTLRQSHIVLNEFYAFVPGVLGIEAMAAHCALLTSADYAIEPALPFDSRGVWLHTRYWEVYDNLKYLLDNPLQIRSFADKGHSWSKKHCSYTAVREHLFRIFKTEGLL